MTTGLYKEEKCLTKNTKFMRDISANRVIKIRGIFICIHIWHVPKSVHFEGKHIFKEAICYKFDFSLCIEMMYKGGKKQKKKCYRLNISLRELQEFSKIVVDDLLFVHQSLFIFKVIIHHH